MPSKKSALAKISRLDYKDGFDLVKTGEFEAFPSTLAKAGRN